MYDRAMGRTMHLDLRQIRPEQRAEDRARGLVLGWYVARHDEDRYDETTEYRVGLFDAATEEELTFFVTSVHERADTGQQDGQHLEAAAFDADPMTIVLRYRDGSEQRVRIDQEHAALAQDPAEYGVVVSDAERELRASLLEDARKLRRRLQGE